MTRLSALILILAATLLISGCSGRHLQTLLSGLPSDADAPFEGVEGPARDTWLGALASHTDDSDLAELHDACEEVPDGQTRRWKNFDTGYDWSVTAQKPDAADFEIHRSLLVLISDKAKQTTVAVITAKRIEKGRWAPAKTPEAVRNALLEDSP